jgi:hypothetical protein
MQIEVLVMGKKRSFEEQQRIDQQLWYDEMHTTQVKLKLNNKTDADILDWISRQKWNLRKSVQGEIKRLIREEIARTTSESCRCTPTENQEA